VADLELLAKCKDDFINKLSTYNKMQDYYDGNTDAIKDYKMVTSRANNKVNTNMIQKFIGEEASYCVGNKITYTSNSNDKNIIEDIRLNTKHWSEKHDRELCKQALIFNEAYELYYVNNDGLFSSIILTPRNSYVLIDDFGNVSLLIRFFKMQFDPSTQYADVYEKDLISHYTVDGSIFTECAVKEKFTDKNIFSKIPVSVCSIGTIYESLFTNIKGSQDGYETVASDIVNEISDFRNAYLKLIGTTLGEKEGATNEMKSSGIMELPIGGNADWLIKDLNDSFVQNTLTTLKDNMYEISSHINHNEKLASNTSSLALRNRLIGLEQKCTNNIQAVQDCLKVRLQFLCEYLRIKSAKTYDYRDIESKLTPNIPTDDLMISQILSQYPNISIKTGLKQFSFISNVDTEMAQLEAQNKAISIGQNLLNSQSTVVTK
jgi:SPP1 family phage portal protein